MSSIQTRSKAVANRIAIVKSGWAISDETKEAINNVRAVLHKATEDLASIVEGVEHDEAKFISCLDKMQEVKDAACASIILPTNKSS